MFAHLLRVSALLLALAACSSTPETSTLGTTGGSAAGGGGPTGLGGNAAGGVTSSGLAGQAAPGSQKDLEVNVGDRVFFGYDSSTIDDTARQTLDKQAAWMKQFPAVPVTIEGHTDERGTREYNLALGQRRAEAAKSYLVALGLDANRIKTISYGAERPVDPGHDESAYALNRRAVTVVDVTQ